MPAFSAGFCYERYNHHNYTCHDLLFTFNIEIECFSPKFLTRSRALSEKGGPTDEKHRDFLNELPIILKEGKTIYHNNRKKCTCPRMRVTEKNSSI